MKSTSNGSGRGMRLGALAITVSAMFTAGHAQSSLNSIALVGAGNIGYYSYWSAEDFVSGDSMATASYSASYTGLNGAGNRETMNFSGETTAQSNYGQLHVYTEGSLTNSYYNASNPVFYNNSVVNNSGSPNTLQSLGFAIFTDTLQFGGYLPASYQAIYLFHIDGTNTGTGYLADLAVNGPNSQNWSYFDGQPGFSSQTFATTPFQVTGYNQQIQVQFSDQVIFNTPYLDDGGSYSGKSDFSETLSLVGVELVDSNGDPFSGWTMTSASGTTYNQVFGSSTPGPASLIPFAAGALAALRRRRASQG